MTNKRPTKWQRVWRVLRGQVNCCICGDWGSPVERKTHKGQRQIWYCESCGALLMPKRVRIIRELALFLFLLVFTVPLSIMILAMTVAPHPPEVIYMGVGVLDALACGVLTTFIFVRQPNFIMTRMVEPHGHCFGCGYNLNYSVSDRCSECGELVTDTIAAIKKWQRRAPVTTHD